MAFGDVIPWGRGRQGKAPTTNSEVPYGSLHREMNRLFDDFFSDFGLAEPNSISSKRAGFSPQIDVVESDKEVTVTAELPGLEQQDLDLNLSQDALTLRGHKKYEREEHEEGIVYRERSFGSFERVVPLSAEIDADKVEAKFKNGVVTVILPKTKESRKEARKITVKSA